MIRVWKLGDIARGISATPEGIKSFSKLLEKHSPNEILDIVWSEAISCEIIDEYGSPNVTNKVVNAQNL